MAVKPARFGRKPSRFGQNQSSVYFDSTTYAVILSLKIVYFKQKGQNQLEFVCAK